MDFYQQEQAKEEHDAAKLRRRVVSNGDFKTIIDMPEGRRFVRRVLGECGVHQSSMVFPADGMTMAFREGRRSVGLWLQGLFAEFPDQYIRLLTEESRDDV